MTWTDRWKLPIVVARVVVDGPHSSAAHTTLVREIFLQGERSIIIVADPLVTPGELHCTSASFDEAGIQALVFDYALDLAAAEDTGLVRTVTRSAWT